MKTGPLEVTSLDTYSASDFAVYFSDDTYATVTAAELAECFPERTPISRLDEGQVVESGDEGESAKTKG